MSTLQSVENKLSTIRKYLKITKRYRKYSQVKIEKDLDLRGAVERYLYLSVQAVIDLSEALVSYKGLRKPTSLSGSFYILNEEGLIPKKLTEKLVNMTGFRNIIAHDYEEIDYKIVCDVLKNGLKDIEQFIKITEKTI